MNEHVYIFTGRVIPERALIDIGEVTFGIVQSDDVPAGELHVQIILSQISARYLGSDDIKNLFTLRNVVEDAVRILLDVAGYYAGYGYDAEIVQMVRPHSADKYVFGIDIPTLTGFVEKAGISAQDIFTALGKNDGNYPRQALADVREAIKSPRDTGFFCYRAIESLKNCCVARNNVKQDEEDAWSTFRKVYSIEKDEIMQVKEFADAARHGNYLQAVPMSDRDRAEVFKKTWGILNKYVLLEKSGPA